ncbi:lysoplasmalogenase family protein [Bizionia myxarmorum]|uniref:Lysoplasmalogenase n=1 Tax=Bizionia myxarmorum TaxID=291186 RepID=A0A5D0R923_9FLAO|nr:lysoplasmalogenase family protein [Bizionia myxarmorum]TYB77178.1 hypothetical protein ES674_10870 [Bizionia myxarmorum]
MIKQLFSNHKLFALLYFSMLLIDILVKLNLPPFPFRLFSKPFILLLLLVYYIFNKTGNNKRKQLWMFLALISFFVGDLLIINNTNLIFVSISLFVFSLGKIFFCLKFSHRKEYRISRLIPLAVLLFCYIIFFTALLLNDLKSFFIPALITFFLTLLMFQLAYLRKDVFNKESYFYVLFGVFSYSICEGMMAIKTFKFDLQFQDFFIMFLYGLGLYFVVFGIINEKEDEHKLLEKQEV